MRHYSAFQLDPTGHVAGRIDLNCIDDQDAMRQGGNAGGHLRPRVMGGWSNDRGFREEKAELAQSFSRRGALTNGLRLRRRLMTT